MFDRHATLNDTQIINYKTSAKENWMVLVGIKSEPGSRPEPSAAPNARSRAEPEPEPERTRNSPHPPQASLRCGCSTLWSAGHSVCFSSGVL